MKLFILLETPAESCRTEINIDPDNYVLNIKEILSSIPESQFSKLINIHGGPYSPSVVLACKGIELSNAFRLSRYRINDNDIIHLFFEDDINKENEFSKENNIPDTGETAICLICGEIIENPNLLKYHPGRLAPQEWVYGITIKWEWSCCGMIVSTPEICFHPDGCSFGKCPDCRKDCSCYQARNIRQLEEENF